MAQSHFGRVMPYVRIRPTPVPKRAELIALRKKKYPGMRAYEFADMLGVGRLHMTSVEVGRRPPSLELALRWIELLAPEANMAMFGELPPNVAERIATSIEMVKRLKKFAPEALRAA